MIGTPRRRTVRMAAAVLACLLAAFAAFTYLSYTAAFRPTDTVTVTSARAGLVMETDAKVKYLGVQVGRVSAIDYVDDHARLTLAIDRDQMSYIPSNAIVRIASTTVFGAKSVEFVPPENLSTTALSANAHLEASTVSVEVNTLFQTLVDTLHKIDPVELNATLSAIGEGLRDNGDNLGATLAGVNTLLAQLNPKLSSLQQDFAKTAVAGNVYADAAPDLMTALDNVPSISDTLVDQRENLNATLLAATGLADSGSATLEPAADDYIAAVQRLRAPAKVLGDYSPEYGCLFKAISQGIDTFGRYIGGVKPGLFISSSFIPGSPAYTYPESLPIVNASGGPNCRGLPDLPTKFNHGSWFRPPFLVTDNAYVPYQPNTELQFDAPSTLQFLFNGAYAERDDF